VPKPASLAGRGGVWFAGLHVGVEHGFTPACKAHPALRAETVEGLRALARRLADAGFVPAWDDALPGVARFYVTDPWGNRLELLATSARPGPAS